MDQTIEQLLEAAKALPENDPQRTLMEQTAATLEARMEKDVEEKHYGGDEAQPVLVEAFTWMGGSLTFAEADDYHEGREIDRSIEAEKDTFDLLHRNIWNSDRSVTEKARLTEQAARDLAKRIGDVETGDRSLLEKVRGFIFGEQPKEGGVTRKAVGEVAIFKDNNGDWRWLAVHSNNYYDRDVEVFPASAHKEFESWVDATSSYPELRLWHVPGTRIGLADLVAYDEPTGFMISSGMFDKGMEDVAEKLAEDDDLACSHGFEYRPDDLDEEGVYARYRSFEITIVPTKYAANPWTAITVGQIAEEVKQGMHKDKRAFLLEKLGEERTQRIEAQLAALGKELDEAGVSFKDVVTEGEPAAASPETAPETAALVAATGSAPATEEKPEEQETPAQTAEVPVSEGQAAVTVSPTSELMAVLTTAIREQLAPVTAAISELQGEVKVLKETDDSKVAATMQPRATAAVSGDQRPTGQEDNVMDQKQGEEATGGGEKEEQPINPYVEMALNGRGVREQ